MPPLKLPKPEPGLVISYAYLWLKESRAGREEGLKNRPCAIVAAIQEGDKDSPRVLVLPVTHSAPHHSPSAIEIPRNVKMHLGLDSERSWIVLSESNEFIWPGPDLQKTVSRSKDSYSYGFLPPRFFETVRRGFIALERQRGTRRVKRTS